ncbi:MAG: rhodanese-like domain-containing protein [Alphaproteobacteria bacterium]
MPLRNLSPEDVASLLKAKEIVLVDVREANEFAAEHIEGAIHVPLSTLDPANLPEAGGKTLVMQCAAGGRSARAVALCQQAGLPVDAHLAGGITAWKAAGFPTTR